MSTDPPNRAAAGTVVLISARRTHWMAGQGSWDEIADHALESTTAADIKAHA